VKELADQAGAEHSSAGWSAVAISTAVGVGVAATVFTGGAALLVIEAYAVSSLAAATVGGAGLTAVVADKGSQHVGAKRAQACQTSADALVCQELVTHVVCAAKITDVEMVPAINGFASAMEQVAGFFNVMLKKTSEFSTDSDAMSRGERAAIKPFFKVMKGRAAILKQLCDNFIMYEPKIRSEIQAISSLVESGENLNEFMCKRDDRGSVLLDLLFGTELLQGRPSVDAVRRRLSLVH